MDRRSFCCGIVGAIQFPRQRSFISPSVGILLADPFFTRSTRLWAGQVAEPDKYYEQFWGDRNTVNGATANIARTGGLSGTGVLQIDTDGTAGGRVYVHSIPSESALALAGEYVVCHLRIRRTAALAIPSPDTNAIQISVGLGNPEDSAIDNYGSESTFTLDHATIAAWTLNEWRQFSFTQQLGTLGLALVNDSRHCMAEIILDTDEVAAIEVDALAVQRQAPPP